MNAVKWFMSRFRRIIDQKKIERENKLFLQERREMFPTCHLANNCKIIDSQLGFHVVVHPNVVIQKSMVGDHSYVALRSRISHSKIGNYCSIGEGISIGLRRHPARRFISTYPAFFALDNLGCCESFVTKNCYDESPRDTLIGSDVWIGNNVIIPGGISIGTGVIIAAGSVVTKDVPPYAIVGGNPASLIRYRFDEVEITFLLETLWWEWPDDVVSGLAETFNDMSTFRSAVEKMKIIQ